MASVRGNIAQAARSAETVRKVATTAGPALTIVALSLATIAVALTIGVVIYASRRTT